jgi:integrase
LSGTRITSFQFRVLDALLAGYGPLRAGEALGLLLEHVSEDYRTLTIRQKAKRGIIQPFLKTKNGAGEVDLCPSLASVLREFTSGRKSGLLFHTSTGAQLLQSNTLQDSLHPILEALNHGKGGFNIFRRFGLTHLEKSDCPDALKHFWSGHAPIHVSERYTKFLGARQYRLDWTERIGMGFSVANPANFRWYRESRKLKRWWTRGDSNPRPPRCENSLANWTEGSRMRRSS